MLMRRLPWLLMILLATALIAGCEGMIDATRKTDVGMNTLSFRIDGEQVISGGRAPDWVVSLFGIFAPHPDEGEEREPVKQVRSGLTPGGDTLWIQASLSLNTWEATPLELYIPVGRIREDATLDYPSFRAKMPYVSGYARDSSCMTCYAYTPLRRETEFLSGALFIRSWDSDAGILSGEFKFEVRMISEMISGQYFRSSGTAVHPDDYVVRPRQTHQLDITRGTFDVNYR